MARRDLSPVQMMRAVELLEEERSQRYVSTELVTSQSVISCVCCRYRENNELGRRPGQGRNRVTTARTDRHIIRYAIVRHAVTARHIRNDGPFDQTAKKIR